MLMSTAEIEEIYRRHIKSLPRIERLRLLAIVAQELAAEPAQSSEGHQRSLLELEGLGAEIWNGIDAQEYVDELRKEWDHRS
jgi:hypothetical protein